MNALFATARANIGFLGISLLVTAAVIFLAWLSETLSKKERHRLSAAKTITLVAMLGAVSTVLMLFDFPLFFVPAFYKLDFSELPVLICAFYLGPVPGIVCEFLKVLLKLVIKGTSTAFVGELSSFVIGSAFVLPASVIYQRHPSKKGAVLALGAGVAVMTLVGSYFNAWYLIPKYAELFGIPLDAIVSMGTAVNPSITDVRTLVLFAVVPFNLLKGILDSVLTFLLYKRVEKLLFR